MSAKTMNKDRNNSENAKTLIDAAIW